MVRFCKSRLGATLSGLLPTLLGALFVRPRRRDVWHIKGHVGIAQSYSYSARPRSSLLLRQYPPELLYGREYSGRGDDEPPPHSHIKSAGLLC